jgi:hypothetical protein
MAYAYMQGESSHHNTLLEEITEYFSNHGYSVLPIPPDTLNDFISMINEYFGHTLKKEPLASIGRFLKNTQKYCNAAQSDKDGTITTTMPYLTWTFKAMQQLKSRERITSGKKKTHYFTSYYQFGYDEDKLQRTFPSVFVQGIDSHIVYDLIAHVTTINELLREAGLPTIELAINPDDFGMTMRYAPFLVPFIQQIYRGLNKLKFPADLALLPTIEPPILCSNPNVVKH